MKLNLEPMEGSKVKRWVKADGENNNLEKRRQHIDEAVGADFSGAANDADEDDGADLFGSVSGAHLHPGFGHASIRSRRQISSERGCRFVRTLSRIVVALDGHLAQARDRKVGARASVHIRILIW